jgi:hypothetical protein
VVLEYDGCGLHEKVGACGTVGLVWVLTGHGGHGGPGNRYRGKDSGRVSVTLVPEIG